MKLRYWPFLSIVLLMSACMWGESANQTNGITLDTLTYTYQNINIKATGCPNQADSGCMIVKVKYPVFKDAAILNDTVSEKLIQTFGFNSKANSSLNQLSQNFVKSYTAFKSQQPKSSIIYSLMGTGKVIRQDSCLLTLQLNGYIFQGGAHGSSLIHFINWNTKTNKNITLSDILVKDYEENLTAVANDIFRKNENLSDTASLKHGYFFKDGRFGLNNNFLITPIGLRFLYNQYEIKPYAAGQTNLLIPYAKIKSLLLPHTVVSQYNK